MLAKVVAKPTLPAMKIRLHNNLLLHSLNQTHNLNLPMLAALRFLETLSHRINPCKLRPNGSLTNP